MRETPRRESAISYDSPPGGNRDGMPPHRQRPFRLRDRAYQRAQGALIDNQFQRAAPQQSRNPFRRAGVAAVPAAHGLPGDMDRRVDVGPVSVGTAIRLLLPALAGPEDVSTKTDEAPAGKE